MRLALITATLGLFAGALVLAGGSGPLSQAEEARHPDIGDFFEALAPDDDRAKEALDRIAAGWRDGYSGMVWDLVTLIAPPRRLDAPSASEPPAARVWRRLVGFLEAQTGERFDGDLRRAQRWIWEQPYDPHPRYAFLKGTWYSEIDPAFRRFFPDGVASTIRLDEIVWGGVRVNGIPPLEYPLHLPAAGAAYLDDDHVVFGIVAGGEARAYPKRIMGWHEMALDRLGDVELTIVYCTLCGTVIPYESVVGDRHVRFGTSGLLYRSNKLMFDHDTWSLWNTIQGEPVVGPLVGTGLRMTHRAVVTTTWGEWRRMHPETTVLSIETGHARDYAEGAAYREYFSTDRLMFQVPQRDDRLANKDEVLVMLLDASGGGRQPVAIAADYLARHRLYETEQAGRRLVVVTSRGGANRVYDAGAVRFERAASDSRILDVTGRAWRVTADALVAEGDAERRLPRVAAQRAFWFGWYAQYPQSVLIR
ncbi:MAG: DUF3179 domain-containing protein [Acidobacteria bacterium]|nr:DUF3179 domain-containing protein [Acidobacteriota bacterium]